jgi:hypothetical protein
MHVYLTPEGKIGVSMDVPNMSGKKKKKKKTPWGKPKRQKSTMNILASI